MVRIDTSERIQETSIQLDRVKLRCPVGVPIDGDHATLDAMGLEYGPSFRGIETMWRGNGEVLTRVRLPSHLTVDAASNLHPALLDSCLHAYPARSMLTANLSRSRRSCDVPICPSVSSASAAMAAAVDCRRSGFTLRDDTAKVIKKHSRSISRSTRMMASLSLPSKGCH